MQKSPKETTEEEIKNLKQDIDELEWYLEDFSMFLPLAVCTLNPLGIVINVNKAFEGLTGYSSLEIIRETLDRIFSEKAKFQKILAVVKTKDKSVAEELEIITKDKKEIIANVAVSARKDREGNHLGYFVAINDITELKDLQVGLEKKVLEKTKELQERLQDLEKFTHLTVGRELKMAELKDKIKKLENN